MKSFSRHIEKMENLETDYVKILTYDLQKDYQDVYNSYEYCRLCTIVEGEKKVTLNKDTTLTYNPSDFLLLPPYTNVDMQITENTKAIVLEISDQLIDELQNKVLLDLHIPEYKPKKIDIYKGSISPFKTEIQKILMKSLSQDANKEFLIDLYIQEVTYQLLLNKKTHDVMISHHNNPIKMSVDYIHKNVEKNLTINELAFTVNMSPSNFSTLFKKYLGLSPKQYINYLKLTKAKEMLKFKTVTEVSFDLSFQNISYFIKIFKDKYGMTPKQYQKQLTINR